LSAPLLKGPNTTGDGRSVIQSRARWSLMRIMFWEKVEDNRGSQKVGLRGSGAVSASPDGYGQQESSYRRRKAIHRLYIGKLGLRTDLSMRFSIL
jgi:hypothetical protein